MKGKPESVLATRWGVVVALLLAVGMVGGIVYDRQVLLVSVPSGDVPKHAAGNFRLMAEAWNLITRFYVDRPAVQPQAMTYGAISGMVDALGDTGHSHFLSPEMVAAVHDLQKQSTFTGIGAEIQMQEGHVVIVAPLDGSPAEKAGLHPGDIILKVDGKNVAGMPLLELVGQINRVGIIANRCRLGIAHVPFLVSGCACHADQDPDRACCMASFGDIL